MDKVFCAVCEEILGNKRQPLNDFAEDEHALFIQHQDLSSLQLAVKTNCSICRPFVGQLDAEEEAELWRQKPKDCATFLFLQRDNTLNLHGSYLLALQFDSSIDLSRVSKKETPALVILVFQPVAELGQIVSNFSTSTSTSSEESWTLAMKWLKVCDANHSRCHRIKGKSSWFPTRLIDLGLPGNPQEQPHLIVTEDHPPSSPYVTLSHRWGGTNNVGLNKNTFESLKFGIEVAVLSQTFKDAILVTRERLNVRYIWIDTFCIFQDKDDLSDWTNEAQQMDLIYENAYCNLSATGVEDPSSQGFFVDRTPNSITHLELDLAFTLFDQSTTPTRYAMFDLLYWERQLNQLPLHRRGWVVQERLLAPRVLHFCSSQLIWECAELDAAEAYPKGLPPVLSLQAKARFKSLDPSTDGKRLRKRGAHDSQDRFFAHQLWPRIVETYTQCMLSFPGDKLIALSGIAKLMRSIIQDEYVAGMWRRYLVSELVWWVADHRQGDHSPSMRPQNYRAPSFSWAAVDGCISFPNVTDQGLLASVENVSIGHVTEDTTSLVKEGYIILKGTLKRLRLKRTGPLNRFLVNINGRDVVRDSDKQWERLGPLVFLDVEQADFDVENDADKLFVLPIRGSDGENWIHLQGLILGHQGAGTFNRLGLCMAQHQQEIDIVLAHDSNEASLPSLSYSEENHEHTIKII